MGTNRKLVLGVFLVTSICLGSLLIYYFFLMPNPDQAWKAAIVDQLSIEELTNSTFITHSTSLLNDSGFHVKYYGGEEVTVDFYKQLPAKGGKIIVLRTHSALRQNSDNVDIFTSEIYQEHLAFGQYSSLVEHRHISKAVFDVPPYNEYFAIGPSFVEFVMSGDLDDSLIILMGCDSLNKTSMAEALVSRGAKVVIGWTRRVALSDTDASILQLLNHLMAENPYTIEAAVEKVNQRSHYYEAKLDFYPKNHETRYYKVPAKHSEPPLGYLDLWTRALAVVPAAFQERFEVSLS